jgi:hypothetical protein
MSTLSRRHLVTTAAALPAIAVPAFASIVSDHPRTLTGAEVGDLYASLDDGDKREISASIRAHRAETELLRLGAELEALIVDWHAQQATDRKEWADVDAALETMGLPDIERGSLPDDEYRAYHLKRAAATDAILDNRRNGLDENGLSIAWTGLHDRQNPLIDAIMAHKPRTLAGLAVIGRAFTLHHAERWEPGADDDLHHRAFMEAVCGFAGVVPVPVEAVQS